MTLHTILPKPCISFIDLPPEVRRQIYSYLFCSSSTSSPISLSESPSQGFGSNWLSDESVPEPTPTFTTSVFRLNKAISYDALHFAYSVNSFSLNGDLGPFSSLGTLALASIRHLTMFNNYWYISRSSGGQVLQQSLERKCTGLDLLTLECSSHLVQSSIPRLKAFLDSIPAGRSRPKLLLDLYVLDRHFSFDAPERDYQLSLGCLRKISQALTAGAEQRGASEAIMRLPRHPKQIDFVSDVGTGFVRALDDFLLQHPEHGFVKVLAPPQPSNGQRPGRLRRIWYVWEAG